MKRVTVDIPEGVEAVIDGLTRESGATRDVPVLSQAAVVRLLLKDACGRLIEGDLSVDDEVEEFGITPGALEDLVPDHKRAKYLREEVKDENWLADMKGGFEGRVRKEFAKRFRNNYDPEAAAELAEGYVREAHIYWGIIENDEEAFEERREFVRDRLEDFRQRHAESEHDPNEEFLATVKRRREDQLPSDHTEAVREDEDVDDEVDPTMTREHWVDRAGFLFGQGLDTRGVERKVRRESPPKFDTVEVGRIVEDARDEVVVMTDGGVDRGDGPVTDGGRDVPPAMREDYWETLKSDGGEEVVTPLSLIKDELGPNDTLHAVIPMDRERDELTVLTLREQPARESSGTVFHLRLAKVLLEDREVAWTKNGMFLNNSRNLAPSLIKAFARARDGGEEPLVSNGLNAGGDDLARQLLGENLLEDDDEPEEREVVDHSDEVVEEEPEPGNLVTCEKCGFKAPRDEMVNFGGGVLDAWVHDGSCPEEADR